MHLCLQKCKWQAHGANPFDVIKKFWNEQKLTFFCSTGSYTSKETCKCWYKEVNIDCEELNTDIKEVNTGLEEVKADFVEVNNIGIKSKHWL